MPRRLALCIGINDLRYMSERNLAFAKADAIAIHRLLTDPRRGNFVSNLLLDSKATKSEILKHIIRVLQNPHLTKDDVV
ncbi:MAG: hypothetical protein OEZ25_05800, partial [Candidatus Bathyarchaeota archaeon]|nr:hypothetical protein [Candidatus Bathyarchaeota archaeon]